MPVYYILETFLVAFEILNHAIPPLIVRRGKDLQARPSSLVATLYVNPVVNPPYRHLLLVALSPCRNFLGDICISSHRRWCCRPGELDLSRNTDADSSGLYVVGGGSSVELNNIFT